MKLSLFRGRERLSPTSQFALLQRASRLTPDKQWTPEGMSIVRRQVRLERAHPVRALVLKIQKRYPYNLP